jgi:hypothetical protein
MTHRNTDSAESCLNSSLTLLSRSTTFIKLNLVYELAVVLTPLSQQQHYSPCAWPPLFHKREGGRGTLRRARYVRTHTQRSHPPTTELSDCPWPDSSPRGPQVFAANFVTEITGGGFKIRVSSPNYALINPYGQSVAHLISMRYSI